MNTNEFAQLFRKTKDELLFEYANGSETSVSRRISVMTLAAEQKSEILRILDDALTDALFTSLYGFRWCGINWGVQQGYTIADENGQVICRADDGELETSDWLAFQSDG